MNKSKQTLCKWLVTSWHRFGDKTNKTNIFLQWNYLKKSTTLAWTHVDRKEALLIFSVLWNCRMRFNWLSIDSSALYKSSESKCCQLCFVQATRHFRPESVSIEWTMKKIYPQMQNVTSLRLKSEALHPFPVCITCCHIINFCDSKTQNAAPAHANVCVRLTLLRREEKKTTRRHTRIRLSFPFKF